MSELFKVYYQKRKSLLWMFPVWVAGGVEYVLASDIASAQSVAEEHAKTMGWKVDQIVHHPEQGELARIIDLRKQIEELHQKLRKKREETEK